MYNIIFRCNIQIYSVLKEVSQSQSLLLLYTVNVSTYRLLFVASWKALFEALGADPTVLEASWERRLGSLSFRFLRLGWGPGSNLHYISLMGSKVECCFEVCSESNMQC